MVNVLIIEDQADKTDAIFQEVERQLGDKEVNFSVCKTFSDVAGRIYQEKFDLIITDLLIPIRPGGEPTDFSEELLNFVGDSEINSQAVVVAITQFNEIIDKRRQDFTRMGIFLLNYQNPSEWRACLGICIQRLEQRLETDFVVICALEEERHAFSRCGEGVIYGDLKEYKGLDCRDLQIHDFNGVCVLQPRMGLVDASIVSAQALSAFRPRVICMAGICAGNEAEVEMGSVLVSEPCWEHQAGKWAGDNFKISHYHENLLQETRLFISQIIQNDSLLTELSGDLKGIPKFQERGVSLSPTATGSAVIASDERMSDIQQQHRKLGGLDMEVYGLYRAASLYQGQVSYFAAKSVVDFANEKKGDCHHTDGAILSARFTCKVLDAILSAKT